MNLNAVFQSVKTNCSKYFCRLQLEKDILSDTIEEFIGLNSADITCKFCKDDMTPVTEALKVRN